MMFNPRTALLAASFALWLSSSAPGAVIYVPDDYSTIQDAVTASAGGDVVVVRPGTYVENIDFLWKSITLRSEKGPDLTVIDGNQDVSVLTIHSGPGIDLKVDGFTITNGAGQKRWTHYGYLRYGGGIYCSENSSPEITNCRITGNSAFGYSGCGGGIYCETCSPIITNCVITGNASDSGGAIGCWDSYPIVTNNTIHGNSAAVDGGGLTCASSTVLITNTILRKNTAPTGAELWIGSTTYPSLANLAHCNVEGGQAAVHVDPGCSLFWGSGMIDADPLFANLSAGDFHLTFLSPCKDAGAATAPAQPGRDMEGDPREGPVRADMGADEFYPHLYHSGQVTAGGTIQVMVVGTPGTQPVRLVTGAGIELPPLSTRFGAFYLSQPLWYCDVGSIPSNGILVLPRTVPPWWNPGEEHPSQALVGPLTGYNTVLTNPVFLLVQ